MEDMELGINSVCMEFLKKGTRKRSCQLSVSKMLDGIQEIKQMLQQLKKQSIIVGSGEEDRYPDNWS